MKKVSKQIIQEAISDILDIPSNVAAGVKNVASSGFGAYNSGKVSNQLKRAAERIGKEWKKTGENIKKPIAKMANSGNPEVKQKATSAINNLQSIDRDVDVIMKKMASAANSSLGSASNSSNKGGPLLNPFDDPADFEDRETTTAYGNKQVETPIQRWVKQMGMGADTKKIGVHEWAKINKAWLEMRTAGINPFDMTPEEAERFLSYVRLRNKAIEAGQGDPYAGWNDHWDHIFGKNKANQMRQKLADYHGIKVSELNDFFGVPKSPAANPDSATPSQTSASPNVPDAGSSRERRKAFRAEVGSLDLPEKIERALLKLMREQGVEKAREALATYKAMQANVRSQAASPQPAPPPQPEAPETPSPEPEPKAPEAPPVGSATPPRPQTQPNVSLPPAPAQAQQKPKIEPYIAHSERQPEILPAPHNKFRKDNPELALPKPSTLKPKTPDVPTSLSHSEKKISGKEISTPAVKIDQPPKKVGIQSVRVDQPKKIGDVPQPQALPPVKQEPVSAYAPKLTDFFSDSLPVPEEESQKPPVVDKGSEIQVGDASNPGFGPPPKKKKTAARTPKKKLPSARPPKKAKKRD